MLFYINIKNPLIFIVYFKYGLGLAIFILVEVGFIVVYRSWVLFLYCSFVLDLLLVESDVVINVL